jgi:uncharacterized protein
MEITRKLLNKPSLKKGEDDTPNQIETILGILFGLGYLTIFTIIPFIILINLELPEMMAASLAQIMAAFFAIIMMSIISRRVLKRIIKGFSFDSLIKGLTYAGIMYLISIIYGLISLYIFKNDIVNTNQQELIKIAQESPLIFFTLAVIVAPLIEELIFRYYIYKPLEKKGFILATLLSTFLFSIVHLIPSLTTGTFLQDIVTLPAYLLPSVIFAVAYYKTNKLAVPIFAHLAFNLVSAIVILFPLAI